jgi:methyl-accepting chemotaxis protein
MKLDDNSIAQAGSAPLGRHISGWLKAARKVSGRFPGRFHSSGKTRDKRSERQNWTDALRQVIADLELLNRNTEQDFLRIGGKLAEFIGEGSQISSELTALGDRHQGMSTSQALTHSLECSSQMSARNASRSDGLAEMRQQVGQLKQTLSGFQTTVSTVRTLSVLTRIETARLGNAGADFGNLADEMNTLAINVQGRITSAVDIADSLLPPVEEAIQRISVIDEGQSKDLPAIISEALASLSSLREIEDAATVSSARLVDRYQAVSEAFKKLIVSIQFHDITRQQVEHVIEALRRLCSESEAEDSAAARDQRGAAAVLSLQSLQLANAGEKFAASVLSVAQSLNDIADNVLEMADESRTLSGASKDQKNSFLLDMEHACTAILTSLTQLDSAESDTQSIGRFLTETIGHMHGSMVDIQAIEIQMHLMALNASICAAHIGSQGDALGVIASSMQQRATESRECSGSLVETLDSMGERVARLVGKGEAVPRNVPGRKNGGMEEMRLAVAELHSSSERSFAQITQIVVRGARLGDDLSATRTSFTVGSLFANAVSSAQQRLKHIAEKVPASLAPNGHPATQSGLTEFAAHYTMQAERDVHDSLARASVATEPVTVLAEEPELTPVPADELGDNVEFF